MFVRHQKLTVMGLDLDQSLCSRAQPWRYGVKMLYICIAYKTTSLIYLN